MNKFSITLADGEEPVPVDIIDLEIQNSVNNIPWLTITLLEENIRDLEFDIVKGEGFETGQSIKISTLDTEHTLFNGIIVALSLGKENDTYLKVQARGDAIKLTEGHTTKLFKSGTTDDQVITEVMEDAGVLVGEIAASEISHFQYFSYQLSPWRLIMARILANGFVFAANSESNSVINLQDHQGSEKTLNIVESGVRHFKFKQDVQSQIENISANAWDITEQKLHAADGVQGQAAEFKALEKSHEALAISDLILFSNFTKSPKELEAQATAQNNYRLLDSNKGRITIEASADHDLLSVNLIDKVIIEGVGENFSGEYIVSGIRHYLLAGQWLMDVDLGISLSETLQSSYLTLPPLPMMPAKVVKYQADEEEIERIPIQLPALAENDLVWARLLSPFASNGEGVFFPPNVDDEVLIDFIDGDCRYPVIVGACHNPKLKPPQELKEEKPIRGIFIKQKDEEVPISVIFDKSSDALKLSSGKGEINLSDTKGSEFVMEEDNVSILNAEIACEKALTISSKEDITFSTDKKVIVKAQATELS